MGFSRRSVLGFSCIVPGFSPRRVGMQRKVGCVGRAGEPIGLLSLNVRPKCAQTVRLGYGLGMSKAPNRWNCNGSGPVMVPPQGFEP